MDINLIVPSTATVTPSTLVPPGPAKRLLGKALRGCKDWGRQEEINTGKTDCHSQAVRKLMKESKCRD